MPVFPYRYTSVAVFLLCALSLVIPGGTAIGVTMLVLGSCMLVRAGPGRQWQADERAIVAVLVLYFLVCAVTNWFHHEALREYDAPARFLLAIPALLLLRRWPPAPAAFWGGLIVGASGGGLLAGWERLELSALRASGYTNPIQYGNISMLFGILCLAGLGWATGHRRARWWVALLLSSACIGILGSILTGSRGSWIGLPPCLIILYRHYGRSISRPQLLGGAVLALAALGAVFAAPQAGIRSRMQEAVTETDGYFETGNANTSVGARLEMWRTGLMIFPEHPWLGWGKAGFMHRKKDLIAQGQVAAFTGEHTHSHNEYIDALVKRGLLGLASLLVFYATGLWVFVHRMEHMTVEQRPYALAGVLVMVNYIGFGMTQAFLTHINGVMTLVFMLVILLSLVRAKVHNDLTR